MDSVYILIAFFLALILQFFLFFFYLQKKQKELENNKIIEIEKSKEEMI